MNGVTITDNSGNEVLGEVLAIITTVEHKGLLGYLEKIISEKEKKMATHAEVV